MSKQIQDGEYRTKAGSFVSIKDGRATIDFDWLEEPLACIECTVDPYPEWDVCRYIIQWSCTECDGGLAELERQEDQE